MPMTRTAARPAARFAATRWSALALASLAGAARADLPPILDRAPKDTVAALVTPSLGQLDKNLAAAMTAIGGQFSVAGFMKDIGLGGGIAMDKPVAVLLLPGDMNAEVPPLVALLPVGDFGRFSGLMNGKAEGDLTQVMVSGEAFYAKPVEGGYAALSPMKELLAKTDLSAGRLGDHAANMGRSGAEVAMNADAFLLLNGDQVRALAAAGQNPFGGLMKDAFTRAGLPNLLGGDISNSVLFKDASAAVIGLRPSAAGIQGDLAFHYKPGSDMAKGLTTGGDSKALLKALPSDPYLLAFAFDYSAPGVKTVLKSFSGEGGLGDPSLFALLEQASGQAGVINPNPAGLFGGLLSRGTYFYSGPDAGKLAESFKTTIEKLNNQMTGDFQASTTYKPGAATIDGASADAWSVKMTSTTQGSPLALIYGPAGGPNGHVVKAKNGVYTTTSPDTKLVTKAVSASNGQGTIAEDKSLASVAALLPANRAAEAYIGVKAIIEQALPWLKMMNKPVDFTPPETLAPIGLAAVVDGGGLRITAYAPSETVKSLRQFANAMNAPAAPAPAAGAPGNAPGNGPAKPAGVAPAK